MPVSEGGSIGTPGYLGRVIQCCCCCCSGKPNLIERAIATAATAVRLGDRTKLKKKKKNRQCRSAPGSNEKGLR